MPFTINSFKPNSADKTRRNSTKTSTQNQPTMLAYRDENNTSIAYSPAPNPNAQQARHDDSDGEALIPPPTQPGLSDYDRQHFTATGRPQPAFKQSGLANLAGDVYSMPQLLPKRYTDDSIIPAIIADVIPSPKPVSEIQKEKKGGLLGKLSSIGSSSKKEDKDKIMKVVYMPRRDYQKWFARDEKGNYVGKEEHRRWTEEELEVEFAKYKPEPTQEKKTGLLSGTKGYTGGVATGGALNALPSAF